MRPPAHRFALTPLLTIDNFHVEVRRTRGRFVPALKGISLQVFRGEALGIVGESGCGKSLTLRGILALDDRQYVLRTDGTLWFDGERIKSGYESSLRGGRIGFIPQDPMTSLNPVAIIGRQLVETIRQHQNTSRRQARDYAHELLTRVELTPSDAFYSAYPHQLSGGQRQRILIAMALAGDPELLLADEPTTALDVTVQAQIVRLLHRLCRHHAMGLLFVSHDLALVSQLCDRIAVMHEGSIVEEATVAELIQSPQHPHTKALLSAIPEYNVANGRLPTTARPPAWKTKQAPSPTINDAYNRRQSVGVQADKTLFPIPPSTPTEPTGWPADTPSHSPGSAIVEATGICKEFRHAAHRTIALDGVSLAVQEGECLSLVGESGCGKTTLARILVGVEQPDRGEIRICGLNTQAAKLSVRQRVGRLCQMVFQNPYASLNPRFRVHKIIEEPLLIHWTGDRQRRSRRVKQLAKTVRLPTDCLELFPHQLSGGQRQRVAIARALALSPKVIIADEPVSALDVSVQARILELLDELRETLGLTLVLVSHNLQVVRWISDRVAVMYSGQIVEHGTTDDIFNRPQHSYTQLLLNSAPRLGAPLSSDR